MRKSFNSVCCFHRNRKIQHCKPQTDLVCATCQALLQGGLDLLHTSGSWQRQVTTLLYFREVWHVSGEKAAKITSICFKHICGATQIKGVCRANGSDGVYLVTFCEGLHVFARNCRKSRGTQRGGSSISPARKDLTQYYQENKWKTAGGWSLTARAFIALL